MLVVVPYAVRGTFSLVVVPYAVRLHSLQGAVCSCALRCCLAL
ncbi:hypothetical protein HMPREF3190_01260 [Umbribacter vaginalis]|nr:hypothetical protein HMPREF3190_01260 [Coriobacteriales bacterium DNF00809]